jgi:prevent-host-death family protein
VSTNYPQSCLRTFKGLDSVLIGHPGNNHALLVSSQTFSYLKANAAEVFHQLAEKREPLVITQKGEAKAVLQDVASYEETQETLALLKILALGNREIEDGKLKPVAKGVDRLRAKKPTALARPFRPATSR